MHTRFQPIAAPESEAADLPVLFLKPTCPWCVEVSDFLDEHGIPYRRVDVSHDVESRARMERLSGQSKVPTLDWHGDILADFGVEELVVFLRARNIPLEDS